MRRLSMFLILLGAARGAAAPPAPMDAERPAQAMGAPAVATAPSVSPEASRGLPPSAPAAAPGPAASSAAPASAAQAVPSQALVEKIGQGDRLFLAGDFRNALFAYQDAVYMEPRYAPARVRLGRAYLALRYPEQAQAQAEAALAADPALAEARLLLEEAKGTAAGRASPVAQRGPASLGAPGSGAPGSGAAPGAAAGPGATPLHAPTAPGGGATVLGSGGHRLQGEDERTVASPPRPIIVKLDAAALDAPATFPGEAPRTAAPGPRAVRLDAPASQTSPLDAPAALPGDGPRSDAPAPHAGGGSRSAAPGPRIYRIAADVDGGPSAPAALRTAAAAPVPDPAAARHYRAGVALMEGREWARAVSELSAAIQADPKLAVAYAARGSARFGLGEYRGAAEDYRAALAADPDLATPLYGLAECHRALGEGRDAAEMYRRYARSSGQDVREDLRRLAAMRARELD